MEEGAGTEYGAAARFEEHALPSDDEEDDIAAREGNPTYNHYCNPALRATAETHRQVTWTRRATAGGNRRTCALKSTPARVPHSNTELLEEVGGTSPSSSMSQPIRSWRR